MAVHHQLPSLPTYNGLSASRIQSLYADIARQKHSNPTSYRANVAWWHTTLDAIVARGWQPQSNDKLILHADPGLPDALRYEGAGKPLCLGTVVTELASTHALIPHAQFLSATQSIYDPGWLPYRIASYVIAKPLWWALQQLNVVGTEDGGHESDAERWRRVKGDYVVVTLLERAADAVLAKQRSRAGASLADSLYSFDSFRAEFAHAALPDVVLSDSDLRVLVKYLERDRRAVITDKEVIKFIESSLEPPAVTAVDQGLLELKTAVSSMSAQVDSITAKIDACTEKAGAALRQKRKELALSYIRSRKQLETLLTQRLGSLEILQSTLLRVEAAADDIQILKTYESSTTTLRTILAHPALQRAAVEGTLEALASASADAREVDDAVRLGGEAARADAGLDLDEDELEAELAALVAEGEAERREREDVERVRREQEARESVSVRDVEQAERAQGSRQEAPVREALAEAA